MINDKCLTHKPTVANVKQKNLKYKEISRRYFILVPFIFFHFVTLLRGCFLKNKLVNVAVCGVEELVRESRRGNLKRTKQVFFTLFLIKSVNQLIS